MSGHSWSIKITPSTSGKGAVFMPDSLQTGNADSVMWENRTSAAHWPWPLGADGQPLSEADAKVKSLYLSDEIPAWETSNLHYVTSAPNSRSTTINYICRLHPDVQSEKGSIVVDARGSIFGGFAERVRDINIVQGSKNRIVIGDSRSDSTNSVRIERDGAKGNTQPELSEDGIPRSFYALVDGPKHVVMSEPFTFRIGITDAPFAADEEKMHVPRSVTGPYTIHVSIHAHGFQASDGLPLERDLRVSGSDHYPTTDIGLEPELQADLKTERTINVYYSVSGQTIGAAAKTIIVHATRDAEVVNQEKATWRRMFTMPTHGTPPDLTIFVTASEDGQLAWSVITPHPIPFPDVPFPTKAGMDTAKFARQLMDKVNREEGSGILYQALLGTGLDVARTVPPAVWSALRSIAPSSGTRHPSVLIISNEPYVPWELARMPNPLLDPALPPFFGVQCCIGRWILCDRLPPPRLLAVSSAATISGTYTTLRNLPNALDEAAAVRHLYGAKDVKATAGAVIDLLEASPSTDLLHFAIHGEWDDDGIENGLVMADGEPLRPEVIAGSLDDAKTKGAPFVFLNACQVGNGSRVFGDCGGVAAAFIRGGATGVIAPLWSIDDGLAKQLALDFYEAALGRGEAPAEIVRKAREAFARDSKSGISLAYQFFGHPSLHLDGSKLPRKET